MHEQVADRDVNGIRSVLLNPAGDLQVLFECVSLATRQRPNVIVAVEDTEFGDQRKISETGLG
jgi:hypothetical protein